MDKLNVLIAGSTGYIGTQFVKLLCKHKNVKIKYLCGNTSVCKNISSYDKDLKKYKLPKIIKSNYNLFKDVDVIFTSLPNGESQKIANKLLKKNISSTFNAISCDGDTSTNDMVSIFSTGKAKHAKIKNLNDPRLKEFDEALNYINLLLKIDKDNYEAKRDKLYIYYYFDINFNFDY